MTKLIKYTLGTTYNFYVFLKSSFDKIAENSFLVDTEVKNHVE